MTEPTRLPRQLRRRAATERVTLPPYTREPVTTEDGLRVVGWSWPPAPVADDQPCHLCDGSGYFTETVEGSNGRDEDVDLRCGLCDGSGVEP